MLDCLRAQKESNNLTVGNGGSVENCTNLPMENLTFAQTSSRIISSLAAAICYLTSMV